MAGLLPYRLLAVVINRNHSFVGRFDAHFRSHGHACIHAVSGWREALYRPAKQQRGVAHTLEIALRSTRANAGARAFLRALQCICPKSDARQMV